jgi:hypothetical protein
MEPNEVIVELIGEPAHTLMQPVRATWKNSYGETTEITFITVGSAVVLVSDLYAQTMALFGTVRERRMEGGGDLSQPRHIE